MSTNLDLLSYLNSNRVLVTPITNIIAGANIVVTRTKDLSGQYDLDEVVISATGGGSGGSINLIGAAVGSGATGSTIYTYVGNSQACKQSTIDLTWGVIPNVPPSPMMNFRHNLPSNTVNGQMGYAEMFRSGGDGTNALRSWTANYDLVDGSGPGHLPRGNFNLLFQYNTLTHVPFEIRVEGAGGTSPLTSTTRIGGTLDMLNNSIQNLATPLVNTDAATKAYVDSKSIVYPQDANLFLNGLGNWTPSLNYPANNSLFLDGTGNWSTPSSGSSGWNADEYLNFPKLTVHWQDASPTTTPTMTHKILDNGTGVVLFVDRVEIEEPSQVKRGWQWKYYLGSDLYLNGAQSLLEYTHDQQQAPIIPINILVDDFTTATPAVSVQFNSRIHMNGNRITGLGSPVFSTDAATKGYIDTLPIYPTSIVGLDSFVEQKIFAIPLDDFTAPTNDLNLNFKSITNLASPVNANDAATRQYVISTIVNTALNSLAVPTANLNLNNKIITNLAAPTASNHAATKAYVDDKVNGSIMQGFVNNAYTTNLGIGDHLKFESIAFNRGTSITLDSSTAYNTSTNTASLGRISLAAGKTYRLTGSINNIVSANLNATRWFNSDTNTPIGVASGSPSPVSTTTKAPGGLTIGYITTSVTTRVELRIISNAFTSVTVASDATGPAWFTVEEV